MVSESTLINFSMKAVSNKQFIKKVLNQYLLEVCLKFPEWAAWAVFLEWEAACQDNKDPLPSPMALPKLSRSNLNSNLLR